MTFICLNIELRTQPLIILVVIAGTDKERPGCSKIRLSVVESDDGKTMIIKSRAIIIY
jgi:hypothetical protein